jgi:hypothetical protein
VLTLTATPIPRTLGLSLEGLRDFSVIATPPQKRLAIKTFVTKWSNGQVREACLREFKRGGQVYFLHNEVDTIENMKERLETLLPEARIVVGHGQLPERELERVMREFTQQKHNLLLCSTIIETGIDNPHANTIVINRADKFGLAQLHQLRGRVGRSHHQAYAYLLTHEDAKPTAQAKRRLEAIQAMEELGSGFFLAMHDLEIRGAGEVLGESQSGEIHEVGFAMYTNMLNAAVRALKAGEKVPDLTQPLAITSEINLRVPALLTNDYCPDVHERLTLYKRLANCDSEDDSARHAGGTDRPLRRNAGADPGPDGNPPPAPGRPRPGPGQAGCRAGRDQPIRPNPPIDPADIILLIQSDRSFKLAGPDKLTWQKPTAALKDQRVAAVKESSAASSAERASRTTPGDCAARHECLPALGGRRRQVVDAGQILHRQSGQRNPGQRRGGLGTGGQGRPGRHQAGVAGRPLCGEPYRGQRLSPARHRTRRRGRHRKPAPASPRPLRPPAGRAGKEPQAARGQFRPGLFRLRHQTHLVTDMQQTENLNIEAFDLLPTPEEVHTRLPLSDAAAESVLAGRRALERILDGSDPRVFVVVGPCSIHDPVAGLDYARRLKALADEVAGTMLLVMRVYFEKPRTATGWKGYINDPRMDDSFHIEEGLHKAREFLLAVNELGLPAGTEALDPIAPQYLGDLIAWTAIGARTSESQTHREMSSGLSTPVGFKNGTDGSLDAA